MHDYQCVNAPGQRTFQANDPLIVEGLFLVVPPKLSQGLDHYLSDYELERGGNKAAENIDKNIFALKRCENKIAADTANAVDRAKGTFCEAAIGHPSIANGHVDGLDEPAHHAVYCKQ